MRHAAAFDGFRPPLAVLESERRPKKVNLKAARVIVAGGAGVGDKANFRLIWDLANCLGGAVGGQPGGRSTSASSTTTTRSARPARRSARRCTSPAASRGAVQHRAGMEESAKILAINTDPDAPIFAVAHYGIVGDLRVVIPKLIHAVRSGAKIEELGEPLAPPAAEAGGARG